MSVPPEIVPHLLDWPGWRWLAEARSAPRPTAAEPPAQPGAQTHPSFSTWESRGETEPDVWPTLPTAVWEFWASILTFLFAILIVAFLFLLTIERSPR